jgi:RHS repeat-associated protein
MKLARLLCLSAAILSFSNFLFAQTAPNFENGWKPYGSYDGTHLDTVNLMNGNLMLHLPLLPRIPQRGSLTLDHTAYLSSKDWQVACMQEDTSSGEGCWWTKGGSGIGIVRPFDLAIHRTVTKTGTGTGTVTFSAGGYTIVTADGASHKLYGIPGTEDAYGEATKYDSTDLTGYHLELSGADINDLLDTFTLTDRHGNFYQGTFPGVTRDCEHIQGNRLPAPGHFRPLVDDSPLGVTTCSAVALPSLVVDSNGNQISLEPGITGNLNGGVGYIYPSPGTDTLGRVTPPTADSTLDPGPCSSTHTITATGAFDYKAPDGTARQIKLCSAEIPIQTAFNIVSGSTPVVEAATGGLFDFHFIPIVSIVLADGSHWTFDYDNYGELTYVGLPTGGSITYTWKTINFVSCSAGANRTPVSRAVETRTLDDGQGHTSVWTYHWGTASASAVTNSVTDPAGNDVVHAFTTQGAACNLFETSTTEYQGVQAANHPLREVDTHYTAGAFATDITTTLYPSLKVKKVHKDPDPGPGGGRPIFGNVIKELEYDWGQGAPGALLQETDTVYKWQNDSSYLTAHLLDLPASQVVVSPLSSANTKSGCPVSATTTGSCVAETDYSYDESTYLVTPTPAVNTHHTAPPYGARGNQSTVSHWLNTSSSFVPSHTKWYDTGEPFEKIDPLGHTTTLSYDPAYAAGYVTQTCSPQTGSVTHCVSGTYDFNTGVLSSLTNENATRQASGNTPGDAGHTSNCSYDFMFRIASAQAPPDPANGSLRSVNAFTYSDIAAPNTFPLTVTRQKSITAALTDSATTTIDGLGRVITTSHAMPSGSPSLVTTGYDDPHSKVTVSNRYFTTADPTYGVTTTLSDALGRAFTVTKQDGSVSSVDYSVGNCTVTTDEAGKMRKACSDALGRLVEVDEPNPGAGISTATGNVSINGHEQANPQPVVPGTGWVAIGGSEVSVQVCQDSLPPHPPVCNTIHDSGSVSITVNGYSKQISYSVNTNNTAALVASSLTAAFQSDTSSPVSASIDGSNAAKINFTSRSQTLAGNYSLSVSAVTNDSTNFGSSSFTSTQSGSSLTGGRDATTSPDAGSVTITLNGIAYSTSYGGSDSDGSGIASRLATLISAGPYANASAAGSTVSLTSKTSGPGGNFSLSAAYTWNSASFAQPSFTTAPSGNGLSGGYNAGDISNNPYITLYAYDALGNLLRVDQKGTAPSDSTQWRTRTFTYDSLSRLLTAHNPESGTITYSYDADGNLLQKTSPAPNQIGTATQTVSYCYDALHRVTGKGYGAQSCPLSTPVATYTYDSGANAKGKLTSLTDQAGTASYSYDVLGRLAAETRTLTGANNASISKSLSYDYNLDGSLKTLHYPSGAAVTYAPDSAGRILSAIDSGSSINYVTGATYGPDSALTGFVSGNSGTFAGITNAFSYNKRLQPLAMSANAPSQTVFSIGYDFHLGNGTTGADNGNVWGITNYKDTTRSQTFTYDSLNRLTSAQNAGTNCGANTVNGKNEYWGNSYGYDAWGNLLQKIVTKCGAENMSFTADAHNWIHASGTDYLYDSAGNMTFNATAPAQTYTYDQENRLTGAAGYTYTYDGDGNRVRKSNGNLGANGTLYWAMTPGVVAETDLAGTTKSEYIFFDGERVARRDGATGTGGVFYYFSDHLKTASVITDSAGVIKAESDYYPWGGELQFVNNDSNDYKFTGKKRDIETGLDYFGVRYYSNGLGRWVSADWSPTPIPVPYADFGDPQSLNLYSYVRGIPTSRIDLEGHENLKPGDWGEKYDSTATEFDHKMSGLLLDGFSLVTGPLGRAFMAAEAISDFRSGNKTSAALGLMAAVPGERLIGSAWKLGNFARGIAIETALGKNLAAGFPVIDKFLNGTATSIKSIDLTAKTYQDTAKLAGTLDKYVDKVANFNGARYGTDVVKGSEITARELQVAIPKGSMSAAQQKVFDAAAGRAAQLKQPVKLSVTQVD